MVFKSYTAAGDVPPGTPGASSTAAIASTPNYKNHNSHGKIAAACSTPQSNSAAVSAELDALRQRGLATFLNQHFSHMTQKLAVEKAAADAALLDLQRRKAQTSDFQFSGNSELSPLDSMCLQVQQWRRECRRKEQETLLLYQRYVDKFGATGQVQNPLKPSTLVSPAAATTAQSNSPGATIEVTPIKQNSSKAASKSSKIPKYSPSSPASKRSASSSDSSTPQPQSPGESFSPSAAADTVPPPLNSPPPTTASSRKPVETTPVSLSVPVPSMAASIEAALKEYMAKGALPLPSVELLSSTEETFSSLQARQEAEFRNYYRRQLEEREQNGDQDRQEYEESPAPSPTASPAKSHGGRIGIGSNPNYSPGRLLRTIGEMEDDDSDDDDDDDEEYNGGFKNNSIGDRSNCEQDEDDLRRDVNDSNDFLHLQNDESYDDDEYGPLILHTTDDDTVVSCLTINSALTREILDDCSRTVADFLQKEQQAIRSLMEQKLKTADELEDDHSDLDLMKRNQSCEDLAGSVNDDDAVSACLHATEQAEILARKMQDILDNFAEKDKEKEEKDDDDENSVKTQRKKLAGMPFPTDNPDEEWIVYYDENYERNYYHEKKSNRTQWTPPENGLELNTSAKAANPLDCSQDGADASTVFSSGSGVRLTSGCLLIPDDIKAFAEAGEQRRMTRIAQYRRKRRRERKRRCFLGAVSALFSFIGFCFYLHTNPQSTLTKVVPAVVQVALPVANQVVDMDRLQDAFEWLTGEAEIKREAELKAKHEAQRLWELEQAKRRVALEAARKAEEARRAEAERKLEEARTREMHQRARYEAEVLRLAEEARIREMEKRSRIEAEALRLAEEQRRAAEAEASRLENERKAVESKAFAIQQYASLRTWACNLPFMYLFMKECSEAPPKFCLAMEDLVMNHMFQ